MTTFDNPMEMSLSILVISTQICPMICSSVLEVWRAVEALVLVEVLAMFSCAEVLEI